MRGSLAHNAILFVLVPTTEAEQKLALARERFEQREQQLREDQHLLQQKCSDILTSVAALQSDFAHERDARAAAEAKAKAIEQESRTEVQTMRDEVAVERKELEQALEVGVVLRK